MRAGRLALVLAALVAASGCTVVDSLGPQPQPRGPGAAYESLLAGSSEKILVELDHAPDAGFDPDTPAEEEFVDQLERITNKEVEVASNEQLPEKGEDYAYSVSELRELHRQHRDVQPTEDQETLHFLFVDGRLDEDTLGLSFATRGVAVFEGQIRDVTCGNDDPICQTPCPNGEPLCQENAFPSTREWKVTRAVAIHEAGHMFGLVNSPLPMVEDHEDPDHQGHSTNESSVMYWQINSAAEIQDLTQGSEGEGEVPWRFGELDIEDARAVQQPS